MKFELKIPPHLQKFFSGKEELIHRDAIVGAAQRVKLNIVEDTTNGKDVDGKFFAQYSTKPINMYTSIKEQPQDKKYTPAKPALKTKTISRSRSKGKVKSFKAKTRRFEGGYAQYKQETLGSSSPDLVNTGRLIENIHWRRVSKYVAELFVRQKDDNDVGAQLNKQRKWWGISLKSKNDILEIFRKSLRAKLKGK